VSWEDWQAFDAYPVIDRNFAEFATTGGLYARSSDITHWSQIGEDLEYRGAMMRAPELGRRNHSPPRSAQMARGSGLSRVELAKQQVNKEAFQWKHTMPNPGDTTPADPPFNHANDMPGQPGSLSRTGSTSAQSTPRLEAHHQALITIYGRITLDSTPY